MNSNSGIAAFYKIVIRFYSYKEQEVPISP
jgi:hypothetical protein